MKGARAGFNTQSAPDIAYIKTNYYLDGKLVSIVAIDTLSTRMNMYSGLYSLCQHTEADRYISCLTYTGILPLIYPLDTDNIVRDRVQMNKCVSPP